MTLAHQNRSDLAVAPDAMPVVHSTQVTDLKAWAEQAQGAYRVAEMIANTDFCPKAYRGKPEQIAASMLAGAEIGFSPMTSLKAFDPIQGVAAINARAMRAVVQSHGHYIRRIIATPERVVMEGHRKGQSDKLETVEWTIERAKTAGYVTKNAMYTTHPVDLLTARATGELCRLIASDAVLGIAYTAEEVRDDPSLTEAHPDERQAALPSPRAAVRGATSMSAADLTGEAPVETPARPDRAALFGEMKAAFDAAEVSDRDAVTRVASSLADRPLENPGELTTVELASVVESLSEMNADDISALAGGES